MECYCTCIIEILSYFFILQSLTTSKMRKFQTLKLSQFHKEKTCWTENWWSSGIMSNFFGEFFYVLGGKKNFEIFFKNILATTLKSYIKWLLYFFFSFFEKVWKSWKNCFFRAKFFFLVCTRKIINHFFLNVIWQKTRFKKILDHFTLFLCLIQFLSILIPFNSVWSCFLEVVFFLIFQSIKTF